LNEYIYAARQAKGVRGDDRKLVSIDEKAVKEAATEDLRVVRDRYNNDWFEQVPDGSTELVAALLSGANMAKLGAPPAKLRARMEERGRAFYQFASGVSHGAIYALEQANGEVAAADRLSGQLLSPRTFQFAMFRTMVAVPIAGFVVAARSMEQYEGLDAADWRRWAEEASAFCVRCESTDEILRNAGLFVAG